MLQKIPQTKVLCLFNDYQKPWLSAVKKEIVGLISKETHKWKIDFASSTGLEEQLLGQIAVRYDWVLLLCPTAATMVTPHGISFAQAGGSLYRKKFLVLMDPQHLFTVPHGKFVMSRYLSKVFAPQIFMEFPAFKWRKLQSKEDFENFLQIMREDAVFASCDIETVKKNLGISVIGFSLLLRDGTITTGVLDCENEDFHYRMKLLCDTKVAKTAQNGIYDNLYLLRWNTPMRNYAHDTAAFMHSWYCELDKDLGSLGAFFLRDFSFWKHEAAQSNSRDDYLEYNAKDCYSTLCIAIAQLREAPAWAKQNFIINFPRVFPCIYMSAHGVLVDEKMRNEVRLEAETELHMLEQQLCTMTSIPNFNSGSSQQVLKLFKALGVRIESSDEKMLQVVASKHPLYERFVDTILEIRGLRKAISTYYNAELLGGVLYYDLIPYGTETGRLASKKSSYWCGAQIQNQPPYAKCYLMAPEGWEIAETDNEQSESRCTAYIAPDENLQRTLESGKDFHSQNAVLFFGASYDEAKKKQEDGSDSPVRAMSKRINHAVSYNMGANEFVRNAGAKRMEEARTLLSLSPHWSHKEIAEYLISLFDRAYPNVRGSFQQDVKREIAFTKMLVGATGWTRRFFRDPSTNKMALNSAIAHGPQSLSVQIINEGMMKMYRKIVEDGVAIRMLAQVHDSMVYLTKIGDDASKRIAIECMDTPVMVKGKKLYIPTSTKVTGKYWAKRKKKAIT